MTDAERLERLEWLANRYSDVRWLWARIEALEHQLLLPTPAEPLMAELHAAEARVVELTRYSELMEDSAGEYCERAATLQTRVEELEAKLQRLRLADTPAAERFDAIRTHGHSAEGCPCDVCFLLARFEILSWRAHFDWIDETLDRANSAEARVQELEAENERLRTPLDMGISERGVC